MEWTCRLIPAVYLYNLAENMAANGTSFKSNSMIFRKFMIEEQVTASISTKKKKNFEQYDNV